MLNRQLIHVAIPDNTHRLFKTFVAKKGGDMTNTINDLIEKCLVENELLPKPKTRNELFGEP